MKLCVLGSGSKGNAVYVEAGRTRVLFDAGFSSREIKRRLESVGVDPGDLCAIFISHEHHDHVGGLRVFGRRFPVFATQGTLDAASRTYPLNGSHAISTGSWFEVGDLKVLPVPLSHDAADPVGFVVEDGERRVGIITDQGTPTRVVRHHLRDLDLAIIESNHDPDMLKNGPYRWDLKQRIRSRLGHLSNQESAELVSGIMHPGLKLVLLAHLSEVNNQPALALSAAHRSIDGSGIAVNFCPQDRPTKMYTV